MIGGPSWFMTTTGKSKGNDNQSLVPNSDWYAICNPTCWSDLSPLGKDIAVQWVCFEDHLEIALNPEWAAYIQYSDQITLILCALHWLPIIFQMQLKMVIFSCYAFSLDSCKTTSFNCFDISKTSHLGEISLDSAIHVRETWGMEMLVMTAFT